MDSKEEERNQPVNRAGVAVWELLHMMGLEVNSEHPFTFDKKVLTCRYCGWDHD